MLKSKIHHLSPGLLSELDIFLNYLINKKESSKPSKLRQDLAVN
jgi:hypothetical protein